MQTCIVLISVKYYTKFLTWDTHSARGCASQTLCEARSMVGTHSSKLWPYTKNWAKSRGIGTLSWVVPFSWDYSNSYNPSLGVVGLHISVGSSLTPMCKMTTLQEGLICCLGNRLYCIIMNQARKMAKSFCWCRSMTFVWVLGLKQIIC